MTVVDLKAVERASDMCSNRSGGLEAHEGTGTKPTPAPALAPLADGPALCLGARGAGGGMAAKDFRFYPGLLQRGNDDIPPVTC